MPYRVMLFAALLAAGAAGADTGKPAASRLLTLERARALALENQPSLRALELSARAMEEAAVADGELPDPRIKLGALNFPTRGFPQAREDMTQWAISYEQMVPGGDKRRLRAERTRAEGAQLAAERRSQAQAIRRDVAIAWLGVYGPLEAERLVRALQEETRRAIQAATVAASAGRGSQAEIIAARQMLHLAEDRVIELAQQGERARAELARWVGEAAHSESPAALPQWREPPPLAMLAAALEAHPQHAAAERSEALADADVRLAREASKPDRSWEVGYMFREGAERSDMVLFQMAFELPLWKQDRQDRRVAASFAQRDRAREQRLDRLRMLRAELEAAWSEWRRSGERLANYDRGILPQGEARIEALLASYRAGRAELGAVLEARRSLFEARIQRLAVEVTQAKARAALEYFEAAPRGE